MVVGNSSAGRWGMIEAMTEAEAQVRPDDIAVAPGDSAPEAPPAATAPAVDDALPEDRYLNRELSWLDFNARVR